MKSKKIVLHFPKDLVNKPIVYRLIKEYDLSFNILKAKILPDEEGLMVMELEGDESDYRKGVRYLKKAGVSMQPLSKDVRRDDEKCTHCGACVVCCPSEALSVNRKTGEINFETEKCIACELCIPACPTKAMVLEF